jgi:tryptophanyl-tRNA synthetase
MAKNLISAMAPLHERRAHFKAKPEQVKEIIALGSQKARAVAKETMAQVRAAIKIKD